MTETVSILVVNDESAVALDIKKRLEELGYPTPAVASSAPEALALARKVKPDVILMDLRLGQGKDGIEVACDILTVSDPAIVYLTAYSDEETIQRARATEPMGYLLKAFNDRELHATIQIATYKREMAAKLAEHREQLELRVKELAALNDLFQQHLAERFEVTDAYRYVLANLERLSRDTAGLVKHAKSQMLPDLAKIPHLIIECESLG
jgi:CheY-like chemotaxis protein